MKSGLRLAFIVFGSVVFGLASQSVWGGVSQQVPVAVSILPLADFTRNVGGERIDIQSSYLRADPSESEKDRKRKGVGPEWGGS